MASRKLLYFGVMLLGVLSLPACATMSNNKQAEPEISSQSFTDRLPPQNLAPGSCGLFIWAGDERQKFIGFETKDSVKLVLDNRTLEGRRLYGAEFNDLERTYRVQPIVGELKDVLLSLVEDKEIAEGTRYYGRLKSLTDEGWERLTPVVALFSCVSQNPATQ